MADFIRYENDKTHRAIYTAEEDILGDLGLNISPEQKAFLLDVMNGSGIDHSGSQKNRCFDYSLAHMDLGWLIPSDRLLAPLLRGGESRYSDGSFGVFYATEAPETALLETIYHDRRRAEEYFQALPNVMSWTTHKLIYTCHLETLRGVELSMREDILRIIAPDDYAYAREVSNTLKDEGAQLLRAPSARSEGGICLSVLSQLAITAVKKNSFHTVILCRSEKGSAVINHRIYKSEEIFLKLKEY